MNRRPYIGENLKYYCNLGRNWFLEECVVEKSREIEFDILYIVFLLRYVIIKRISSKSVQKTTAQCNHGNCKTCRNEFYNLIEESAFWPINTKEISAHEKFIPWIEAYTFNLNFLRLSCKLLFCFNRLNLDSKNYFLLDNDSYATASF